MLDVMLEMLADDGIGGVELGMAHRGRLSTIAHFVNRPDEELLGEFESASMRAEIGESDDTTGDVKYHHGAHGEYVTPVGTTITVELAHNPSHLEAVDGVLGRSKIPPVVVIQSDEGFQANPDPFGEAAMQDIRVKGLSAFYLPGLTGVPQPPNTVNTLRFVLNKYFGTHYKLLRSASYPEGDLPYQYKEMRVR